jgi:hypothetical protein
LCRGAPSCRFFIAGEPRNKNDACGYPQIPAFTSLPVLVQDVSNSANWCKI